MGGASSVVGDMLEDEMDEEFLKNLMKENFDPVMFSTLQDEDRRVNKDMLLSIINRGAEREVYTLFMGYTPSGKMDAETYMRMCSNCKLLNKELTRAEAGDIFRKSLFRRNIPGNEVTFYLFRDGVLPDFADERHVDVQTILNKLARFDPPDSDELEREYRQMYVSATAIKQEEQKHTAAMKLQKVTRGKNARKLAKAHLKNEKTSADLLAKTHEKIALRRMNTMDEQFFLRSLFESYCQPANELSARSFKKLCRDFKLYDTIFLPTDSEIAFTRAIAEISTLDKNDPLHRSVIFDKRIEYPVFTIFLIPEVAELKGIAVHDLLLFMKENETK